MRFRPVSPEALVQSVVDAVPSGTVRVAVDGPPCAHPGSFADAHADGLRASRPVAHVRAETFWRDASLRFEHGKQDVEAYLTWLDAAALRREVLEPVMTGRYLPSLRDPVSNRSTREPPRDAPDGTVLIVSGAFLLGQGLPFDLSVHLAVSPAARARQTDETWTLPAFDEYDATVRPFDTADVVVRYDDPRHPAVRVASPGSARSDPG
jgi:hypothetical protein